jgi:uncharacterized membrane protein YgcG
MKKFSMVLMALSTFASANASILIFHPLVSQNWSWPIIGPDLQLYKPTKVSRSDPVFGNLLSYINANFHDTHMSFSMGPDDSLGYIYAHYQGFNPMLGESIFNIRYRRPHLDWNYLSVPGGFMWLYDPIVGNVHWEGNYAPGSNLKWIVFTYPGSVFGPPGTPYINWGPEANHSLPFYYGNGLDTTPDLWGRWWQRGMGIGNGIPFWNDPFIQYSAQLKSYTWAGRRGTTGDGGLGMFIAWQNIYVLTELVQNPFGDTEVRLLDAIRFTFNPPPTTAPPFGIGPGAPPDLGGGGGGGGTTGGGGGGGTTGGGGANGGR